MRWLIVTFVFLVTGGIASAQNCDVGFAPETVKPTFFESFKSTLKSFNRQGEAQRLSEFREIIVGLKEKKSELKETLKTVLQHSSTPQNSLPSWLKARTDEIPAIEKEIVALFRKMHTEYEQDGLFAGDPSYKKAQELIDGRVSQLRKLCLLTSTALPMSARDVDALSHAIADLQAEIDKLNDIDGEISKLIQKAQEQAEKKAA